MSGRFTTFARAHSWDTKLRNDVMTRVLPWMEEQGAQKFCAVGFCWGAYGAIKCAAFPQKFVCCASFHPSTETICRKTGEDDLQMCREVRCPQLVVSTSMETSRWQPGGAAQEAIEQAAPGGMWELAKDVKHGYMIRSNIAEPANRDAVQRGYTMMLEFFKKNMPT